MTAAAKRRSHDRHDLRRGGAPGFQTQGGERGDSRLADGDGHGGVAGLIDKGDEIVGQAVDRRVLAQGQEQASERDGGEKVNVARSAAFEERSEGHGDGYDADEGFGVNSQAGDHHSGDGLEVERVLGVDGVGQFVAPLLRLGHAGPAHRLAAVLDSGEGLHGADEEADDGEDGGVPGADGQTQTRSAD